MFTGGRDGCIFNTDLTGEEEPVLLYSGGKTPITALNYDAAAFLRFFVSNMAFSEDADGSIPEVVPDVRAAGVFSVPVRGYWVAVGADP